MIYDVKTYVGLGELKFGMTKEEIRNILGGEVKEIKKALSDKTTDVFVGQGIHVYYNQLGKCEAIECGKGGIIKFKEKEIIGKPFKNIEKMFRELDDILEISDTGFVSYKLGIGVYVPTLKKSKSELIQGVIIFERGYYDKRQ